MNTLRLFSTLALTVLMLMSCNSPTSATRLGAKWATLAGLQQTDATADEAQSVVTIAVMVKGSVGGEFDTDILHDAVLDALSEAFDGQQRLIYLAIADELLTLIKDAIADVENPLELGEAGIYINAAAIGVERGAGLYLVFLESEE